MTKKEEKEKSAGTKEINKQKNVYDARPERNTKTPIKKSTMVINREFTERIYKWFLSFIVRIQ